MTQKMRLVLLIGLFIAVNSSAQNPTKQPDIDTSFTDVDYDELFNELDLLRDSLTTPRNFGLFNVAVGYNYFNYQAKESYLLVSNKKLTYSPTLSYFLKNGLGISINTIVINDGEKLNP